MAPTDDTEGSGSLSPSDYYDGASLHADRVIQTVVVGSLFAIAAWVTDTATAYYMALRDAMLRGFDGLAWLLSFPFAQWPGYMADAFQSAAPSFQMFGLFGFTASAVFLTLFVLWLNTVFAQLTDTLRGDG